MNNKHRPLGAMSLSEYYRRRNAAEMARTRRKIRYDQCWLTLFLGAAGLWLGFLLFAIFA